MIVTRSITNVQDQGLKG